MTVSIRQTLRNARVVGEFAVKGLERMLRERLTSPQPSSSPVEPIAAQVASALSEPISGYDLLTASQIISRSREWSGELRANVREYEGLHRKRKSVLEALR